MLTIKVNGKKINVLSSYKITVKQYFQLVEKGEINVLDYISLFSDVDYKKALNSPANNRKLAVIESYMYALKPFHSFTEKPSTFFVYNEKIYRAKDFKKNTLGVRLVFEQFAKEGKPNHECGLFILASMLANNYDMEESKEIYKELLNFPYVDVMPFAGFFLSSLQRGSRAVIRTWMSTIKGL